MARPNGNRAALVEGAIECLQTRGYARSTARDLAAAAGVHLGALTYHFPSKEALLNEALAVGVKRWVDRLGAGRLDVETLLRSGAAGLRSHRWLAVAYVEAWAQAERSPEVRADLATHYRRFRTAVAGTLPPGADGHAVASLRLALVDGLMIQVLLDEAEVPGGDRLVAALQSLSGR